jgi:hypothetical protein
LKGLVGAATALHIRGGFLWSENVRVFRAVHGFNPSRMKPKVFAATEIEQFVEDGYVLLREAFPREVAAEIRKFLWSEIGLSPDDPSQWTKPFIHIQKTFSHGPFREAFTQRVWDAYDDVLGEGRYEQQKFLGWWPIAFPGFEPPPWKPPTDGWHVDGIQFHHHVNSRDQGLLPIFLLSDIGAGDGGTCLSAGSHKITARILADAEPAGLDVHELAKRVREFPRRKVVETTGRAGDVMLLHPFMLHARSPNTGKSVRFICNPCVVLREPMNLNRANAEEYSAVERAIVEAIAN